MTIIRLVDMDDPYLSLTVFKLVPISMSVSVLLSLHGILFLVMLSQLITQTDGELL